MLVFKLASECSKEGNVTYEVFHTGKIFMKSELKSLQEGGFDVRTETWK